MLDWKYGVGAILFSPWFPLPSHGRCLVCISKCYENDFSVWEWNILLTVYVEKLLRLIRYL